jgi:hypothetical protein
LTLTFAMLLASWVAVENCHSKPATMISDAGTDGDAGTGTDAGADLRTGTDTGAGTGSLSPHEREEAAKDELDRARAARERGDLEGASAALERASAFDPHNPDIAELQAQLLTAEPDGG